MHATRAIKSTAVFTGMTDLPEELTVCIDHDRILFVGPHAEAERYIGDDTLVEDYGDALVVAGFHDSHLHFFHTALYASPLAASYLGENEADCVERLHDLAATRPEGSWLLTQGWREYRWNPPVTPSKHSLDAAFPDRPVAMYSGDAHTLWVNSRALEELGLTRDSVPPAGGSYDRDEDGELTGIIREAAAMELMPQIVAAFTMDELCDAYRGLIHTALSYGITSVCDMSLMAHPGLDFVRDDIYRELERRGELDLRINMFPTLLDDLSRFEEMREGDTDKLRTPGFKQFFDGVSSQHTAYLHEPYTNARFEGDRGATTVAPERMRELVLKAAEKRYPVRIHTIGDEAIHLALDFFGEGQAEFGMPQGGVNCLEHVENFQPEDMRRMADLEVLAAIQPCHITLDPGGPERDLGPERVKYMWPVKTLMDLGVTVAFGTDAPVTDIRSFDVLYAAVTRQDPRTHEPQGGWLPDERITLAQALRAYTLGSAAAAGRQNELGSLEAGKLADIAVVDRNLFVRGLDEIQHAEVLATYLGGEKVYERED